MRWIYRFSTVFNPNSLTLYRTYYHSLPIICDVNDQSKVETFHAKLIKDGSLQILNTGNHLLSLYVKSRNLGHAQKLFDEIRERDVRTWSTLLSGLARNECFSLVLDEFRNMQIEGVCPNQFTLSTLFKCCSSLCEVRLGKELHGWIIRNGMELDNVLENSILDFYVNCYKLEHSKRVFESMEEKSCLSWNIMLGAYLRNRDVHNSLALFKSLSCKDVATWNTVIDGLRQIGFLQTSLDILRQMVESRNLFNKVTFSIALNLASSLCDLELGKQLHCRVLIFGIQADNFIQNSLIDMYNKCGVMEKASKVFSRTPRDSLNSDEKAEIVSRSSLVTGFVQNGNYEEALKTYISIVREGVKVDKFTLTSLVSACEDLGIGEQIHAHILKGGHSLDSYLASSLVDMFAKCGSFDEAQTIFEETKNSKNVVLWTSMISSYAAHGRGMDAVHLFECMRNEGIEPNPITFVGVLTACSHAGLLEQGQKYFTTTKIYSINPEIEHFNCMVDLYGRAGHLEKANEFIHEHGISHFSSVWKSFLSSCRLHHNVEMEKWALENLLKLEPSDAAPYILSASMLASDQKWEAAANMRSLMQKHRVNKLPALSWIQMKN
ncbi:putative pentatricopeptide repeat-containing protein At3g23330 [Rutidosis leptorrhynchoides]|uniref:putative pentatricopeptide repeat-containing protein At3g23330 n=1 Tax=Rutidosis leptorrhynchoides TaxID=125765 RepID=UPI003A9A2739